jgi:hypothetical protein
LQNPDSFDFKFPFRVLKKRPMTQGLKKMLWFYGGPEDRGPVSCFELSFPHHDHHPASPPVASASSVSRWRRHSLYYHAPCMIPPASMPIFECSGFKQAYFYIFHLNVPPCTRKSTPRTDRLEYTKLGQSLPEFPRPVKRKPDSGVSSSLSHKNIRLYISQLATACLL